jgi:hypothetical protein
MYSPDQRSPVSSSFSRSGLSRRAFLLTGAAAGAAVGLAAAPAQGRHRTAPIRFIWLAGRPTHPAHAVRRSAGPRRLHHCAGRCERDDRQRLDHRPRPRNLP